MAGMLRFLACGSVDDGKSTLIGRLLHDTRGLYDDQLDSVRKASRGGLDLAYITDGLRAEREQKITIDVAYRHFATPRRRFIIADTPGHEQYTRNMATGASTADAAVILIDAQRGVLEQSRRHAYIASLLGIRAAVVAVNKMDLVDFDEGVFGEIRGEFGEFLRALGFTEPAFLPVSALAGDNVVERSGRMAWYEGPSLLEHLENVEPGGARDGGPLRLPVQLVIRPDAQFRGYAGMLAGGRMRVGDRVLLLPSRLEARIATIRAWGEECEEAAAPAAVTVSLDCERDVSRGDMMVDPASPPAVTSSFRASLIWMAQQPLRCGDSWLLKHTSRLVCATVRRILWRTDIHSLEQVPSQELRLNDIAEVEVETHHPLFLDPYAGRHSTGSFVLIDPMSNQTAGAGMVREDLAAGNASAARPARQHRGLTVWLTGLSGAGKSTVADALHDRLAAAGYRLEKLDGDVVRQHLSKGLGFSREDRDENIRRIGFVAGLLTRNQVVVIVSAISPYRAVRQEVKAQIGSFLEVFINAPLEVCEQRDPKGLYRRARSGQLPGFTGVSDPYEAPLHPDVECRTDGETVEESAERIFRAVESALS